MTFQSLLVCKDEQATDVLTSVLAGFGLGVQCCGYPDALCAEKICDVVRILTISDIFAALIEDRRYKPPMPREQAYDILCGMQGKLEKALVAAFRPVALDR